MTSTLEVKPIFTGRKFFYPPCVFIRQFILFIPTLKGTTEYVFMLLLEKKKWFLLFPLFYYVKEFDRWVIKVGKMGPLNWVLLKFSPSIGGRQYHVIFLLIADSKEFFFPSSLFFFCCCKIEKKKNKINAVNRLRIFRNALHFESLLNDGFFYDW